MLACYVDPVQKLVCSIDIDVQRNAYGCQLESFAEEGVCVESIARVSVVFIRTSKVMEESAGAPMLGKCDDQPTGLQQGCVVVVSFHFLNEHGYYGK